MKRRDFIGQAGAAALGVSGLTGCATTGATSGRVGERPPPEPVDLQAWAARVDAQERALYAVCPDPRDVACMEGIGFRHGFGRDAVATMLWLGSVTDLPEPHHRAPEVQDRLAARAPHMADTVLEAATLLRDLPEDRLREVCRLLRDEPDAVDQLHDDVVDGGFDSGVRRRRLRHFTRLYRQVVFRLTEQDPAEFVAEVLDKADRRLGRSDVRLVSLQVDRTRPPGLQADGAEPPEDDKFRPTKKYVEMNKDRRAGLVLLAIGAGATVTGVPLTFVAGGFAGMITVGVILLILALIFSLAGLGRERRAWREAKAQG